MILTIKPSSFSTVEAYHKEVKSTIYSILAEKIKLIGLEIADLSVLSSIRKYQIGRDDETDQEGNKHQVYRAKGIFLVEAIWSPFEVTINQPLKTVDYTETKRWISNYNPPKN